MAEPCPICSEPLDCGRHRLERRQQGGQVLICPSYEEFVLDGSPMVMVQIPQGVLDGPGDPTQGPTAQD